MINLKAYENVFEPDYTKLKMNDQVVILEKQDKSFKIIDFKITGMFLNGAVVGLSGASLYNGATSYLSNRLIFKAQGKEIKLPENRIYDDNSTASAGGFDIGRSSNEIRMGFDFSVGTTEVNIMASIRYKRHSKSFSIDKCIKLREKNVAISINNCMAWDDLYDYLMSICDDSQAGKKEMIEHMEILRYDMEDYFNGRQDLNERFKNFIVNEYNEITDRMYNSLFVPMYTTVDGVEIYRQLKPIDSTHVSYVAIKNGKRYEDKLPDIELDVIDYLISHRMDKDGYFVVNPKNGRNNTGKSKEIFSKKSTKIIKNNESGQTECYSFYNGCWFKIRRLKELEEQIIDEYKLIKKLSE